MNITDILTLDKSNRKETPEGVVIFYNVPVARTGVQEYQLDEFSGEEKQLASKYAVNGVVLVHRLAQDVSEQASLDSYLGKWITVDHVTSVTTANHHQVSVGRILNAVFKDEHVRLNIAIDDKKVVELIDEMGSIQASAGYGIHLVEQDGKLVQKQIRVNHVALVDKGRCGESCRIGDKQKEANMPDLIKITVDGLTVETTEQGKQMVDKLQQQLDASNTTLSEVKAAHKQVVSDKDKELGQKDAEIEDLKAKQLTPDQMDVAVATRSGIVTKVKSLGVNDTDMAGKSNDELRRLAVGEKHPDIKLDGKSADYVEALFDGISVGDPVKQPHTPNNVSPLPGIRGTADSDTNKAYSEMVSGIGDAWKGEQKNA